MNLLNGKTLLMEKSLYFQLVNKYFPQLVASVVEKLNGKNQTALTYMYRDHLTNTYSQDGRWASITAEYTRVAADVVSMDAELPLKRPKRLLSPKLRYIRIKTDPV